MRPSSTWCQGVESQGTAVQEPAHGHALPGVHDVGHVKRILGVDVGGAATSDIPLATGSAREDEAERRACRLVASKLLCG